MSRRIMLLSLAVLLVSAAAIAGETAWFDMANCGMCKNMYAREGLLDNVKWEQHPISNGIVSVTTVTPKYMDAYREAHADMKATGMKMQQGEMMEMCGSCTALGMCMMKGLNMEYVETSTGDVWVMTADNPEVVKEVQAWAKRNQEEAAKMKAHKKG